MGACGSGFGAKFANELPPRLEAALQRFAMHVQKSRYFLPMLLPSRLAAAALALKGLADREPRLQRVRIHQHGTRFQDCR